MQGSKINKWLLIRTPVKHQMRESCHTHKYRFTIKVVLMQNDGIMLNVSPYVGTHAPVEMNNFPNITRN